VQLEPGESTDLAAYLERSLPPYTYRVTADTVLTTPSGGYLRDQISREIDRIDELDESCTTPSICGI